MKQLYFADRTDSLLPASREVFYWPQHKILLGSPQPAVIKAHGYPSPRFKPWAGVKISNFNQSLTKDIIKS